MHKIIVSVLLSGAMGCSSVDYGEKYKTSKVEIQGHRGARMLLPENTLPAFEYALQLGVDTLELDLGVSKDGIVIVNHDQKINSQICQFKNGRPIQSDMWIHKMSLKEIKDLDCGSKVNPRFPKQRPVPGAEIPTLDEVFTLVKSSRLPQAKSIQFNIETKSDPKNSFAQPTPLKFAKLVLEVIEKHGMESRVTVQSFDHRTLLEMKSLTPNIQLAALFGEKPEDWVRATKAAKADIVSPYFKQLSQADVNSIQHAGLKVIPWTANTTSDWAMLLELGVDGIITDDPESLMKMLGRL